MELRGDNRPVGGAVFDRLDDAVTLRSRLHHEAVGKLGHTLVVDAVDRCDAAPAGENGQAAAVEDLHGVGVAVVQPGVTVDPLRDPLDGQVLVEGPSHGDVHHLHTTADPQHRLSQVERRAAQVVLQRVARGVEPPASAEAPDATAYGGRGADTVLGDGDHVLVYLQDGDDTYDSAFVDHQTVYLGAGDDEVDSLLGSGTIYGGPGDDTMFWEGWTCDGFDDSLILRGGIGADTLAIVNCGGAVYGDDGPVRAGKGVRQHGGIESTAESDDVARGLPRLGLERSESFEYPLA